MSSHPLSCPQCGKGDIRTKQRLVERQTGRPIRRKFNMYLGGAAIALGLFFALFAVKELVDGLSDVGLMSLVCMVAPLILAGGYFIYQARRGDAVTQLEFECAACGHTWTEREEDGWEQVACLQCGEHKVTGWTVRVNPETNKSPNVFFHLISGGFLSLFGLGVGIGALANTDQDGWPYMALIGVTFGGLGAQLFSAWAKAKRRTSYTCQVCGHEWQQWEDGTVIEETPEAENTD